MGMIYQFRLGPSQFPVDPQVAGEALDRLGGHNSGEITPDDVVEAARPADHPLHPVFEWDDAVAAERHRRAQAGDLLRSIVAVIPKREQSPPTRAFVSVKRESGQGYVPIQTAMSDPELREQVLAGAMRELVAWRRRHRELQELADLFAQVDLFADRLLDEDGPAAG